MSVAFVKVEAYKVDFICDRCKCEFHYYLEKFPVDELNNWQRNGCSTYCKSCQIVVDLITNQPPVHQECVW